MKHLPTFDSFLSESETLNESVDKTYTVAWNRDNEKRRYDYMTKMMDLADKAIKALPAILEDCCPGAFDTKDLGFAFKGNAAFVFANVVDQKVKFSVDYGKIQDNKEFQKFFDMASFNLDSSSQRMFSSYFRLDDRKA